MRHRLFCARTTLSIFFAACAIAARAGEPAEPARLGADDMALVQAADTSGGTATAEPSKEATKSPDVSISSGTATAVSDTPEVIAGDRSSRLAALKAKLHQRMRDAGEIPADPEVAPPPSAPRWGLRQPSCLQSMGISVSGWLEQGITLNGDYPTNRFNGPVAANDRADEYQMNQLWLTLERPVNTHGDGWDFGGRIDAMYGTDWRFGINNGLEDRINGLDGQTYGMVIPQAYAAVGYNDLTVKLGHYAAILDYEAVPAPANFFYSHSYCYSYCVPKLVTGMLADYRVDENWSVQGGLDRGWEQFEDNNASLDFLAGFRWQSSDRRTQVAYSLSNGPQDPAGQQNRFVYSLVVQEKLGPRSQYVLVHDLGVEANALNGGKQAEWYGLNQYYIYTINSQWAACVRAEWLRDADGSRVAGPGNIDGVRAWSGHGFTGNFYEVTAGVNWRPQPNIIFRPEVRYDWYDGGMGGYGPSNQPGLPFNDGKSNTQFLTAADLIVLF